jgi:O-antigen ligase
VRPHRPPAGDAIAAALGFLLVFLPGVSNGWYDSEDWASATIALGGITACRLLLGPRPSLGTYDRLTLGALGGLAVLMAFSGSFGVAGAEPWLEFRRALLYLVALVTLVVCVAPGTERRLLEGAAAGAASISVWALTDRILGISPPLDPFQGPLLTSPVGYANALGVLAAMGSVLAVGLSATARAAWTARAWRASALVMATTIVLTESRGAVLALAAGSVVTGVLASSENRKKLTSAVLATAVPAGVTAVLAPRASGAALALVVAGTAVAAAAIPPLTFRRGRALVAVGFVLVVVIGAGAASVAATSGHRPEYWRVALDAGREHLPLGAGAGSFDDEWLRRRTIAVDVRDAHNLYLETFAELGIAGLVLVGLVSGVPLVAAVRYRRREPMAIAAGAYAVYVVHAGLDWDWEMPVTTLAGLTAAAAILAASRAR